MHSQEHDGMNSVAIWPTAQYPPARIRTGWKRVRVHAGGRLAVGYPATEFIPSHPHLPSLFRPVKTCFVFILLLALAGCHANPPPNAASAPHSPIGQLTVPPNHPFPRSITDARGKPLTLLAPPRHIVSLAPSTTEILFALDLGDRVVADTTACDYPPEAKKKPHIGGFQTDIEAVQVQNPDLVVGDAVYNQTALTALEHAKVPILALSAKTLADVYNSIQQVGTATGQDMQAAKTVQTMQADIDAIRRATSTPGAKPKVLILHALKPSIYTTGPGSFIDELITVAGGQNIVTTPAPAGNTISSEQVVTLQPDVIIADRDLIPQIKQMPGWATGVPAVRNNRFFTSSDPSLLVRPGPRLALGAEELAKFLRPDIYDRSK
jgi:iron complex transport system substrate-binding protein